jgi:hypothetical protein
MVADAGDSAVMAGLDPAIHVAPRDVAVEYRVEAGGA